MMIGFGGVMLVLRGFFLGRMLRLWGRLVSSLLECFLFDDDLMA